MSGYITSGATMLSRVGESSFEYETLLQPLDLHVLSLTVGVGMWSLMVVRVIVVDFMCVLQPMLGVQ